MYQLAQASTWRLAIINQTIEESNMLDGIRCNCQLSRSQLRRFISIVELSWRNFWWDEGVIHETCPSSAFDCPHNRS
jgi:hypothetical protein